MPEVSASGLPTVVVVLVRCRRDRARLFGIRVERVAVAPDRWLFTWSFPVGEGVAGREGYGERVAGAFDSADGYPGCPYCQAKAGSKCSSCDRLTCFDGTGRLVTCAWCGARGLVLGRVRQLGAGADR